MNFGLVETLLEINGHKSVQKYIELTGKHLALLSAALYAICFFSVAMNAQLTTADIIGTVSEPNYFVANNQNDGATTNAVQGSGFGKIVTTNPNYTPRELQLALKLLF